ncbi:MULTISPECIES: hypothetical protein [unclassified Kitasatospora]|uniref:hypothetical protein n=1 Tax=unclassified Kitasatospora TaxID=2633591 RepID=UPI00070F2F64|nr:MULTISPECIES: hypothetical protein [unclassified Kitasatospora]KQV20945.1 hypothetical protein ASC99_20805 [Kitasatospora sp. Root107]KRB60401.1 hypothetical protein ASE03_12375 [Kitasatospora sp. Root187]
MAALRSIGAEVRADPEFESSAHPGHPSPSSVAAGVGATIVTPGAATAPTTSAPAGNSDVAVGEHPLHGITATNPSGSPAAARLLATAGFYRVPGHPTLLSLTEQQAGGPERARDTVAKLRAAGLSVAADTAFEPHPLADDQDPFHTRVIKAAADADGEPELQDPFATRIIPAPKQDTDRPTAPTAGLDPFATQLHPAPGQAAQDSRVGALLSNRQAALAAVQEILDGLAQQLRDDPQALDPAQVSAVLEQAQTTLGGVRRDLETISAAAPARAWRPAQAARPAASPALGARAQAATATSLRLGRVSAAQPVEAAAQSVDPRLAYINHSR